jgi:hypothetical protein
VRRLPLEIVLVLVVIVALIALGKAMQSLLT